MNIEPTINILIDHDTPFLISQCSDLINEALRVLVPSSIGTFSFNSFDDKLSKSIANDSTSNADAGEKSESASSSKTTLQADDQEGGSSSSNDNNQNDNRWMDIQNFNNISSTPNNSSTHNSSPTLYVSLDLDGYLIREADIKVNFVSKGTSVFMSSEESLSSHSTKHRTIHTRLVDANKTPWVLEQILLAVESFRSSMMTLQSISQTYKDIITKRNSNNQIPSGNDKKNRLPDIIYEFFVDICSKCDNLIYLISNARNAFLLPNKLGFPQVLKPSNAFSPNIPNDTLIEFNVFKDLLVVTGFALSPLPADQRPEFQGVTRDIWFYQHIPDLVGKKFVFEHRAYQIAEEVVVSFTVPSFGKTLAIIDEVYETIYSYRSNILSLLHIDERFYSTTNSVQGQDLIQPSLVLDDGQPFQL